MLPAFKFKLSHIANITGGGADIMPTHVLKRKFRPMPNHVLFLLKNRKNRQALRPPCLRQLDVDFSSRPPAAARTPLASGG